MSPFVLNAILSLQRTLTQITHKINHALGKCSLQLTHSCTLYERKEICDDLASASTEDLQRPEYDADSVDRSHCFGWRGGGELHVQDKLKMKTVFLRKVSSCMPNHTTSHTRKQIVKINTKPHNDNASVSTYDY